MDLTEYQTKVLRGIKKHQPIHRNKLALKLHPNLMAKNKQTTYRMVTKAIEELELGSLIYCSNPDVRTWKLTEKGHAKLA